MKLIKNLLTFGAGFGTGYAVCKKNDIANAIKGSKPVQTGATKLSDICDKIKIKQLQAMSICRYYRCSGFLEDIYHEIMALQVITSSPKTPVVRSMERMLCNS